MFDQAEVVAAGISDEERHVWARMAIVVGYGEPTSNRSAEAEELANTVTNAIDRSQAQATWQGGWRHTPSCWASPRKDIIVYYGAVESG